MSSILAIEKTSLNEFVHQLKEQSDSIMLCIPRSTLLFYDDLIAERQSNT